jgi:hypothetical protein
VTRAELKDEGEMNKLWILDRVTPQPLPQGWRRYDCVYGVVVRARTEDEARSYAANASGDEGKDTWMDPTRATCFQIPQDGDSGVLLRDYRA